MNRAGLQSLLRDARAGKFNAVLSEALDRLSRDQADIATIFKRLEFAGVEIVTLSEGRIGILDVRVRGTMNRLYSIETGNKVRRGQGNRVKEGKAAGGIPYGYDLVRRIDDRGQLIRGERMINLRRAQIVRQIFQLYAAGRSPRAIAHKLNKGGVPGPAGRGWTPSTIVGDRRKRTGILNNEVYIGQVSWNRRTYVKSPESWL
jgi:DNA invertase Pin-like site-specific DNA recombinase